MTFTLVQPYNPAWSAWFESIRTVLERALGEPPCQIEHVGSTAIPGMSAKPIVDLDVIVPRQRFFSAKERLEALGYVYQGDLGVPGREAFDLAENGLKKTLPPHHLYVCMADASALADHLAFRDFMRRSPEWIRRLSRHKIQLCERYNHDRQAYIEGKAAMVLEITVLARSQ